MTMHMYYSLFRHALENINTRLLFTPREKNITYGFFLLTDYFISLYDNRKVTDGLVIIAVEDR
jgi:hypothetical protein